MSNEPSDYTPRPVSNRTTYGLAAVAVILIALIVFFAYRWGTDTSIRNEGYGSVRAQSVAVAVQDDGTVRLGRPDAARTIDIYEDPLCPGCGALEKRYGQEIAQHIDEGKLAVRYRFVNFLDPKSDTGDYSTRAIAALQCVAETGSGPAYSKFHDTLFTSRRPAEGSSLPDQDLAAIARESGASETAQGCITSGTHHADAEADGAAAVKLLTEALDDDAATPTVLDGDTKIDVNDSDWVQHLTP